MANTEGSIKMNWHCPSSVRWQAIIIAIIITLQKSYKTMCAFIVLAYVRIVRWMVDNFTPALDPSY